MKANEELGQEIETKVNKHFIKKTFKCYEVTTIIIKWINVEDSLCRSQLHYINQSLSLEKVSVILLELYLFGSYKRFF